MKYPCGIKPRFIFGRYPIELLLLIIFLLPQSREVDGDGVTRAGALHLQLGSRGMTRGRSVSMLATTPTAAALTAHHHPAQGSQPERDRQVQKQNTVKTATLKHWYKTLGQEKKVGKFEFKLEM